MRKILDLGGRDAVDKTLQRMVASNDLRRIDRGLYDQPRMNALTGHPTAPDYRSVIDAVGRRDQVRVLIDGMTAANDLGLTNAVPGQVIVHTDGRLRPIVLDKLSLKFKLTAPSKLYWAGRPAMRVVQALYWLRDGLQSGTQVDLRMQFKPNSSDCCRTPVREAQSATICALVCIPCHRGCRSGFAICSSALSRTPLRQNHESRFSSRDCCHPR